jgi:hypothetical protein
MADTAKRLSGPTQLGTSATTQYTVPASTTAIIRSLLACNTTANQVKLTVSIGADAAGTRIFSERVIAPRETFEYHGFIVLTAAGILQAYADTATALTLTVSGVEVT